jgi:S-adenosylmethionine/arginine decarboxylase-like enzyme
MLMADVNCPPSSCEEIEYWMSGLVKSLGMKELIQPKAVYCNKEGNEGVTCICAIETSHIVLHSWDGQVPQKIQLDIYTCSKLNIVSVWEKIKRFEAYNIQYKFYDRKNGFKLLNCNEDKRIEENLKSNFWHFAKTMPQIPHWYTRAREWESLHQFAEAVDLINRKGVIEKWGKASYKYYYIDEYKYWTMEEETVPSHKHILINRAKA